MVFPLFVVSCSTLHFTEHQSDSQIVSIHHVRGHDSACLVTCVDMVLEYYGYESYFANCPALSHPASIVAMDSLLHTFTSPNERDPYQLNSFILQGDESFLQEQLARERPVILIFHSRHGQYHSVVLAGVSRNGGSYYVHDPAVKAGKWMSRGKLLKRWKSSGNTALLIGIAPAGT